MDDFVGSFFGCSDKCCSIRQKQNLIARRVEIPSRESQGRRGANATHDSGSEKEFLNVFALKQDPSWANCSQPPDSSTPRLAILSKPPVYMGHSNTMIGTLDTVISPASRPHTKQNPQNFQSSLELNLTTGDGNSKQNAESNALYDTASSKQAYEWKAATASTSPIKTQRSTVQQLLPELLPTVPHSLVANGLAIGGPPLQHSSSRKIPSSSHFGKVYDREIEPSAMGGGNLRIRFDEYSNCHIDEYANYYDPPPEHTRTAGTSMGDMTQRAEETIPAHATGNVGLAIETLQGPDSTNLFVAAVRRGGPAAKAVPPILVGDLVLTIQGASVKSMDSKQALALLQGAAGSEVRMTMSSESHYKDITLIRMTEDSMQEDWIYPMPDNEDIL